MTVQELNRVFGENVRRYRKQKGIRFGVKLAKELGVSRTLISDYGRGARLPHYKMLVSLAFVLGVEPWQLFYPNEAVK